MNGFMRGANSERERERSAERERERSAERGRERVSDGFLVL